MAVDVSNALKEAVSGRGADLRIKVQHEVEACKAVIVQNGFKAMQSSNEQSVAPQPRVQPQNGQQEPVHEQAHLADDQDQKGFTRSGEEVQESDYYYRD